MGTTIEHIQSIFRGADIKFDADDDGDLLRTIWVRDGEPVTLMVFVLEEGGLVQLRAPVLLRAQQDANKQLLFRAMLQMAYEIRLVQFEYDPEDGEVSTCIDIAVEDAALTDIQLLRCCSVLLDVSFLARDRLEKILRTGKDPALEGGDVEGQEGEQAPSQLDAMAEIAKLMGRGGGGDA